MHNKRLKGHLTTLEKKCAAVTLDRYDLQHNPRRENPNNGTKIKLNKHELKTLPMFQQTVKTMFDELFKSRDALEKARLIQEITLALKTIVESVRGRATLTKD